MFTIVEDYELPGIKENGFPRREGQGRVLSRTIEDAWRGLSSPPRPEVGTRFVALAVNVDGLEVKPWAPIPGDVDFVQFIVSGQAIAPERIGPAYPLRPVM